MTEVGARRGYAEASVERVIEGTGIVRSTFYEHFRNRDECFLAALSSLGDRLLGKVTLAAEGAEGEVAGSVLKAIVGFAEKEPAGASLLFVQSLAGGRRSLGMRETLRAKVTAIVEAAWGREPADEGIVDLPAALLVGGVFRLLGIRLRHGEAGLEGLGDELIAWADSYKIATGPPRWRQARRLSVAPGPPPESLPSLDAPLPLSGGRHRLSGAEVARSQRSRILRAAAKCSYERGYAAVRVADITSAARVSRKVFYEQFRDKGDASMEATERVFQGAMSACAAAFFAAPEWPERIWAGGMALLSFFAAHPEDAYLSFVEPHAIGVAAIQHVYDRLGAFTLFLEEGYRYRREAELLPRASSEALAAVMFEIAYAELWERRDVGGLLAILPQLTYATLAPFMGPEDASEFVMGKMEALA